MNRRSRRQRIEEAVDDEFQFVYEIKERQREIEDGEFEEKVEDSRGSSERDQMKKVEKVRKKCKVVCNFS
ncbi:hypothetical protein Q3G72_002460 [Acer saccharum]|nr:hypothetical protein Q3G72_002460 [Acer saccharum]